MDIKTKEKQIFQRKHKIQYTETEMGKKSNSKKLQLTKQTQSLIHKKVHRWYKLDTRTTYKHSMLYASKNLLTSHPFLLTDKKSKENSETFLNQLDNKIHIVSFEQQPSRFYIILRFLRERSMCASTMVGLLFRLSAPIA